MAKVDPSIDKALRNQIYQTAKAAIISAGYTTTQVANISTRAFTNICGPKALGVEVTKIRRIKDYIISEMKQARVKSVLQPIKDLLIVDFPNVEFTQSRDATITIYLKGKPLEDN